MQTLTAKADHAKSDLLMLADVTQRVQITTQCCLVQRKTFGDRPVAILSQEAFVALRPLWFIPAQLACCRNDVGAAMLSCHAHLLSVLLNEPESTCDCLHPLNAFDISDSHVHWSAPSTVIQQSSG